MAQKWGEFKVNENRITMPYVRKLLNENRLLELFGIGTALIVCPIERIHYLGEDLLIPTMKQEKPVYKKIYETLYNIQYGKDKDHPWAVTID
jgi:branched-chain amino acid aminotransferase